MITEFITKYYIDPIRYGQPYNIVDTLTYAVILIIAVYLIYRWLNRTGFPVDGKFVLATIPFIVLGGLLRVVEDTGYITSDLHFLLITPLIFFVIFFITVAALLLSRTLERAGKIASYPVVYAGIGALGCMLSAAFLVWWGLTYSQVSVSILLIILTLATGHCRCSLGIHAVCPQMGICERSAVLRTDFRPDAGRERHQLRH